ncbi:MAG: AAA-like domain-containing protein [Rivularia sp. (in: cyanobacteria)]
MSNNFGLRILISALMGIAGPIKNKLESNENVIKILKKINLAPEHPPADFSVVYAYTLVEYGVGKPKYLLKLFRQEDIKKAFRKAFDYYNSSIMLDEVEAFIDAYALGDEIKALQLDVMREVANFATIFVEVTKRSRTSKEVLTSNQITSLHQSIAGIQEQLKQSFTQEEIGTEMVLLAVEESKQERFNEGKLLSKSLTYKNEFIANENLEIGIDTNVYTERPPIEEKCLKAILQPGALIRIKAPQKMGKTLLLEKILDYSRLQGYQTAKLDLKLADKSTLTDLKTFLQWLCSDVADILEKQPNLNDYWRDNLGLNTSCSRYFQRYLLDSLNTPLVLAIDNFERLFTYENIFSEFCLLLRSWYETAKQSDRMGKIWKKLRLVVVNSTEVYPTLDINRSPFNVGLAIDLPEFSQSQVEKIVRKYQLDNQLREQEIIQLMSLVGGHPYLIQEAMSNLKNQEMSLESLLNLAPTSQGIFSSHLGQQLETLQANSQLELAYKGVIQSLEPIQLNPEITFKLHSMGLVKILRNDCVSSCDLYRQYFSVFLR